MGNARWRVLPIMLSAVLAVFPGAFSAEAPAGTTVYFYSPETNINNFSALKGEFDGYLAGHGSLRFQPFSDRETFEKVVVEKRPGLYLLSSWHFKQLASQSSLQPVLVGTVKDKTTQKHVLFARKTTAALADLKGQTVASAGTKEYTLNLLKDVLGAENQPLIDSMKILVVPKDIDALMAVGFGMAKAAIATDTGAGKLARVNPKQFEALHSLASGSESLLPVLALPAGADAALNEGAGVFAAMGAGAEGRQRLLLLGLEGMKPLAPEELKSLR